ncbi:hypothetical protein P3T27_002562 [Kitasatospora sp. MAA19]|nr:hypothetical protein [Kitasatospora sp. MAA19]
MATPGDSPEAQSNPWRPVHHAQNPEPRFQLHEVVMDFVELEDGKPHEGVSVEVMPGQAFPTARGHYPRAAADLGATVARPQGDRAARHLREAMPSAAVAVNTSHVEQS